MDAAVAPPPCAFPIATAHSTTAAAQTAESKKRFFMEASPKRRIIREI